MQGQDKRAPLHDAQAGLRQKPGLREGGGKSPRDIIIHSESFLSMTERGLLPRWWDACMHKSMRLLFRRYGRWCATDRWVWKAGDLRRNETPLFSWPCLFGTRLRNIETKLEPGLQGMVGNGLCWSYCAAGRYHWKGGNRGIDRPLRLQISWVTI